MNIKRKIYCISAILFIFTLLCACSGKADFATVEKSSAPETTEDGNGTGYGRFDRSNYMDVLELVIEKGHDWSSLPLSDKFRKTYKPEDGLLEKKDYVYASVYDKDVYGNDERSFKDGQAGLDVLYEEPKYVHKYYNIYFTVNDKEQLDTVEIKFDEEVEVRGEGPLPPVYMDEENYSFAIYVFVTKEDVDGPVIESIMQTDRFKEDYKKREGKGYIPDAGYEKLDEIVDLNSYSEKKVVLDAVYADKIIRYNVYFTTDSELRLDSITVVEESVRERETE